MRFWILLIAVTVYPISAIANPVVIGRTYEIAEKDYVDAMKERAKLVEWEKIFSPEAAKEKFENFQPINTAKLPKSTATETYYTDPTYTLEYDLKGPDGKVRYPAGFSFNPLNYMQMPLILAIIDGSDKEQVAWFQKSAYAKDDRVMLLLTNGKWGDLKKKLNRNVFYLPMKLAERIQVRSVPAVVSQSGNMMEVRTYAVDGK